MFSLIEKVCRYYVKTFNDDFSSPLLDSAELLQLRQLAESSPSSLIESRREQAQPLQGEALSVYYGQGLEFEENRLYSQGDDPRFINWRLLARTGELYSKVFRESRRPQLFIVMDRRARMHFATRSQLKVTLAAKVAAFMIYQALAKQYSVAGVVVEESLHWFDSAQSESRVQALLQAAIAPSHPVPFTGNELSLEALLQQVQFQSKAGNVVLLLSDFYDLDKACEPLLLNLTRQQEVIAVSITDPAELQLPTAGALSIADETSDETLELQSQDNSTRLDYTSLSAAAQKQTQARLKLAGCKYLQFRTDQELESIITGLIHE